MTGLPATSIANLEHDTAAGPWGVVSPLLLITTWLLAVTGCTNATAPPTADGDGAAVPTTIAATVDPAAVDVQVVPSDRMSLQTCVNLPCPAMGEPDAPVTIIEISDYQCEYCAEHLRVTQPLLVDEYVTTGKARLVSHVFALLPPAQIVAAAALCADEQGKYFEFQELAFERNLASIGGEQASAMVAAATDVGADATAFQSCVDEGRYLTVVLQSTAEAQQLGVQFTPSFVINGLMIEGAEDIAVFRSRVDRALEAAGTS